MASALPPHSFHLDRRIFNDDLYAHIRSTWFAGLPRSAKVMNDETAKRWWGKGATPAERTAFDDECRGHYGAALAHIGPTALALPAFTSYAADLAHAGEIAGVLVDEVREANARDPLDGAMTLVALVVLLDQVPRNIYRDYEGLRLVYGHYDRVAWTLVRAAEGLEPGPLEHGFFRGNPVWASWLSMPLMHAEDLASQDMCVAHAERLAREAAEDGDEETARVAGETTGFAMRHRDIIRRFGRFPHRGYCLGREVTGEEEAWLRESGETFGVKIERGDKDGGKSEL